MVHNDVRRRLSTRNARNLVFIHESILEIHFVREHALADGERRGQVLTEKLLLRVLLNGANQLPVDLDLERWRKIEMIENVPQKRNAKSVWKGKHGLFIPTTLSPIPDLVFLALFGDNVGGLLLLEDFAFAMTDLLGLGATEVFVIHRLRNVDARNVDLVGR